MEEQLPFICRKPKDRLKAVQEGAEIECMVTAVDLKEHKLSLSVKALHKAEERENIRHYAKQSGSSRTSLADLLDQSVAQKLKEVANSAKDPLQTEEDKKPQE